MRYFILLFAIVTFCISTAFAQEAVEKPHLVAQSDGEDLTHVMDLAFSIYKDGKIQFFIADVFQSSVLVMEKDEKNIHLTSRIGQGGKGPGEFSDITNLQLISNSELMVYDRNLARISIFNLNNPSEIKTIKIDPEKSAQFPMYFFGGGTSSFYARGDQYFSDNFDPAQERISILQKYNYDGQLEMDSLLLVPADEAFVFQHKDLMSVRPNPIWGKKSIFRFAGDKIYYVWGGESQIGIYNAKGKLLKNIKLKLPQLEILREDQNQVIAFEADMMEQVEESVIRNAVLDVMPDDYWPLIHDFHVDNNGNFWVALPAHMKDEERIWQVWNMGGEKIKEFRLPSDFIVHQIKHNFIAGELFDMDNFISKVQLYKVDKF